MSLLTMTPLRRTMLRSALGGFAIGTAALLAMAPSQAQVFGGHNSDAPVSVAADHGELLGRQDRATLAGNVVISQGGLTLRGDSPLWIGGRPRFAIEAAVKQALDPQDRFPTLDD